MNLTGRVCRRRGRRGSVCGSGWWRWSLAVAYAAADPGGGERRWEQRQIGVEIEDVVVATFRQGGERREGEGEGCRE